jgi:hypothetical protein
VQDEVGFRKAKRGEDERQQVSCDRQSLRIAIDAALAFVSGAIAAENLISAFPSPTIE